MDYQTKLILRFDDDDDGSGKLSVEASSKGFCGHGGAYFAKTELEAFANSLAMYPLSTENLPKNRWWLLESRARRRVRSRVTWYQRVYN